MASGDFNGDGHLDLVIGAPTADLPGKTDAGKAYVVFGTGLGFGLNFDLGNLDAQVGVGSQGFVVEGAAAGDYAGCFVSLRNLPRSPHRGHSQFEPKRALNR